MLHKYKLVWGLTLAYALLIGCSKDDAAAQAPVVIKSPLTQRILDSAGVMAQVFSDTLFEVSPGIKETDIHYLSREGYSMRAFILEVDANHPGILLQAGTPYNAAAYAMQTVPEMAKYMEKPDYKVMAAVNADFFNTTTGEPRGIYVKDGTVLKTTWANARSATFMGVLKNGKPYIGDRADFLAVQNDLEDALGGGPMLVRNNQILTQTDLSVEPRTGIGMNENGKMYFIVVDGRSFYYSNGVTITQLGHMLKACGSTIAINVDGGGSSTFMIKHPLANVWQVRNRPSDGTNRPVGNAWMIISR
ncbi:phosphodiester glycosidase family protein [Chitinophaga deserti]|uniref:phosphodiester glycosidase family protein n=1 Tax=Chitinophaga deserti TaxID=2164099 RepID=UPI000D6AA48E|nr:phosphodiester glycosidase family protein [Chitinophaga deserti]